MDGKIFKQSIVGGFDKTDVLEYIEKLIQSHQEEIMKLQTKYDDIVSKKKELEIDMQNLSARNTTLDEKNANTLAKLADKTVEISKKENEIKNINKILEQNKQLVDEEISKNKLLERSIDTYTQKNSELERKITDLERIKHEYLCIKDKLPEMELEAFKRSENIKIEAMAEAGKIRRQSLELVMEVKSRLIPIYDDYSKLTSSINDKFNLFKSETSWLGENMGGIISALDKTYDNISAENNTDNTENRDNTKPNILNPNNGGLND